MRGPNGGGKLLLTASPNHPRIQLTSLSFENPAQPPMFCMLLRKHLTGGRLVSISQPPLERLVELTFDCIDEMGTPCQKKLILEIMGRNSNLILTGADGRILDCLRRVDFEMSEQRQVLPGLYYHLPPTQGKRNPWDASEEELRALLCAQKTQKMADSFLLETFGGLSPLLCRELAYAVFGQVDSGSFPADGRAAQDAAGKLFAAFDRLHTASGRRSFLCATSARGTSPAFRSGNMKVSSHRSRSRLSPRAARHVLCQARFFGAHAPENAGASQNAHKPA